MRIYEEDAESTKQSQRAGSKKNKLHNRFCLFDIPESILRSSKTFEKVEDGKLSDIATVSSKQIAQSTSYNQNSEARYELSAQESLDLFRMRSTRVDPETIGDCL